MTLIDRHVQQYRPVPRQGLLGIFTISRVGHRERSNVADGITRELVTFTPTIYVPTNHLASPFSSSDVTTRKIRLSRSCC